MPAVQAMLADKWVPAESDCRQKADVDRKRLSADKRLPAEGKRKKRAREKFAQCFTDA